ncbi:MAG: ferrous iron transport protein A [Gammaproteobacteria bacterium]|nr:MAG: ferrous iron transport protein A [Gammaproteobacteria bacterium]
MTPLSKVSEKHQVRLSEMRLEESLCARLVAMGLSEGSVVTVLRNRSGDVVLAKGRARVSLSRQVAAALYAQPIVA